MCNKNAILSSFSPFHKKWPEIFTILFFVYGWCLQNLPSFTLSHRPRCESSDKDVLLDINEHDELLKEELDSPSNPVFMPKRKTSHRKWKRSRRYRPQLNLPSEGTPPPAYSPGPNNPISPGGFGRALEKIPEEDYNLAGDSFSETDEESSSSASESTIVNMSHFNHANCCTSSIDSSFSSSVSSDCTLKEKSIDSSTSDSSDWSSDCSREQKRPRELFFKTKKQKYIPVNSSSDSGLSSSLSESVHRKANSARSCNMADNEGRCFSNFCHVERLFDKQAKFD